MTKLMTLGLGLGPDGGNRGGGFSPLSLNPALWQKADAGTLQTVGGAAAVADGDPVGQWLDQSGNARHAGQAVAGKRFTLKLAVQNGRPGLLLDGVDDCLVVASLPLGPFTVFAVFKLTGTAGIIYEHSANSTLADGCYLFGTTGESMSARRATRSAKDRAANWAVDGAAKLITHTYDGTQAGHTLRINAAAAVMTDILTADPGTATATATLNLGARNDGASLPSTGHLFELIAYGSVLAAADRDNVEAYLRAGWGTP